MALETLVPIATRFGVTLPAGVIILYRHHTNEDGKTFMTEFSFYASREAILSKQVPIDLGMIDKMVTNDRYHAYATTEIKHDDSSPETFQSWDHLFDGMALSALLSISAFALEEIQSIGRLNLPSGQTDNIEYPSTEIPADLNVQQTPTVHE